MYDVFAMPTKALRHWGGAGGGLSEVGSGKDYSKRAKHLPLLYAEALNLE